MSEHFIEIPAPVMSDAVLHRRREHLLAEMERPNQRRLRAAAVVATTVALGALAFAPITGASLAHRIGTGLESLWSSPAPPPADPAEVQGFADNLTNVPPGVINKAGAPLPGAARDLLTGLGGADDTVTAFPTTKGEVCYMIMAAGSCGFLDNRDPIGAGITFSILWTRITGTTRVFGVASDKVASVSVIVGGVGHPAILENNAFYYELSPGVHSGDVQEVIATWKDGSVHQFPVHR